MAEMKDGLYLVLEPPKSESASWIAWLCSGIGGHGALIADNGTLTRFGYCGKRGVYHSRIVRSVPGDCHLIYINYSLTEYLERFVKFESIRYRWWRNCLVLTLESLDPNIYYGYILLHINTVIVRCYHYFDWHCLDRI